MRWTCFLMFSSFMSTCWMSTYIHIRWLSTVAMGNGSYTLWVQYQYTISFTWYFMYLREAKSYNYTISQLTHNFSCNMYIFFSILFMRPPHGLPWFVIWPFCDRETVKTDFFGRESVNWCSAVIRDLAISCSWNRENDIFRPWNRDLSTRRESWNVPTCTVKREMVIPLYSSPRPRPPLSSEMCKKHLCPPHPIMHRVAMRCIATHL